VAESDNDGNARERFVRLAEARVTKAIKDVRLIANLSNRSNYKYTDEDVREIFGALEREIRGAKEKFSSHKSGQDEPKFSLSRR
jgi:hypothetical protein